MVIIYGFYMPGPQLQIAESIGMIIFCFSARKLCIASLVFF